MCLKDQISSCHGYGSHGAVYVIVYSVLEVLDGISEEKPNKLARVNQKALHVEVLYCSVFLGIIICLTLPHHELYK